MQTPAGYEVIDGRFFPKDWLAIIFSPSFPYRLAHTVSAFYVTTAFVVLGRRRLTVRRGRCVAEGRMMLRLALWFLAIFVPLQIVLGDMHGLNTLEHQPAKLAAIEGALGRRTRRAARRLSAGPTRRRSAISREIAIPACRQPYLTHSWDGAVKGLKDFPRRSAPAGGDRLFRVPHHGRHRLADAGRGRRRLRA